jgi:hypothetical protein
MPQKLERQGTATTDRRLEESHTQIDAPNAVNSKDRGLKIDESYDLCGTMRGLVMDNGSE